jgi:hydroxymethylglutaryl-CoA lyase
LVLNRKGFERALAAGCTEVGMAIAASESFSQRNQGCSVDEGLAAWLDIAQLARDAGHSRATHDLHGLRLSIRR